ncbi:four-helix bundle copper-binding protein [Planococcus lenghuensis]|uniref:Four-helix bundle copper-binding protein n=1 Tax=Planococcus lenghuensis TaxID=2213202 RepID=A0A1Q2KYS4_9BACL|nr:four-helix bundle copper-binding protein [Planococcus lenghuensis]AQQ53351.1 hypothetical protein B0X71_09850 [Planococcus lenghuensis]
MAHEHHQEILDALHQCLVDCNICFNECLNDKEHADHLTDAIRLARDCADTCSFAEQLVTRNSQFHEKFLQFCAEVCDACAKACDHHGAMDHCKACVESCRKCAEVCRKYV